MLKNTWLFILIIIFNLSCLVQKKGLKTIRFSTFEANKKVNYLLNVPRGFELKIVKGSHEKEYRMIYPDSSIIYITNDYKSGSYLNPDKEKKYGANIFLKILETDTISLEGSHINDNYWREDKLEQIVIGYMNVSDSKKEIYNKLLKTIQKN